MIVFLLVVAVLLIGLTAAAVMGRIGGFMAEPTSSQAFGGVPAGSLSSDDVGRLHFDQGLRGYRMDQVDEVIDALAARLRELEAAAESEAESESESDSESETETETETEVAPPAADALLPAADDAHAVTSDPSEH